MNDKHIECLAKNASLIFALRNTAKPVNEEDIEYGRIKQIPAGKNRHQNL